VPGPKGSFTLPRSAPKVEPSPLYLIVGDSVSEHIKKDGYYENEIVHILNEMIVPGMVFFDIGAHIGQYTLLASQLVGPNGTVHSFEADPRTFDILKKNVEMNHLGNVIINNVAIADKKGFVDLFLSTPENIGMNSIISPQNYSGEVINICAISIDEYVKERGINNIDIIKADIEGAELLMLKGCRRLLSENNKPILILEINKMQLDKYENGFKDICNILISNGYYLYKINSENIKNVSNKFINDQFFNILATTESLELLDSLHITHINIIEN